VRQRGTKILPGKNVKLGKDHTLFSVKEGIVKGRAIVFDSPSNVLTTENGVQFVEVIKRSAVTEDMLNTQDIQMLYNHTSNSPYGILARSKNGKGSLKFMVDDEGVRFEFRAKKKDAGLIESIEAGDIEGCSFAFKVNGDDPTAQTIFKRSDGLIQREINSINMIRDFSIVADPAYPETSVSLRSLEDAVEKLNTPEPEPVVETAEAEAERRDREFAEYYKRIRRKYM
jgi:HK97 family phage prohead protease